MRSKDTAREIFRAAAKIAATTERETYVVWTGEGYEVATQEELDTVFLGCEVVFSI